MSGGGKIHRHRPYKGFEVYSKSGYEYYAVRGNLKLEHYDLGRLHEEIFRIVSEEEKQSQTKIA